MSTQTKKIRKKITAEETKIEPNTKTKKKRDWVLVSLIAVTGGIMFLGRNALDMMGWGMYLSMIIAMICLLLSRHIASSEKAPVYLTYAATGFMGLGVVLMLGNVFNQYIAN